MSYNWDNKNKRWRIHNSELKHKRERNTVNLVDIPIVFRIKPTSHQQICYKCRMPIEKGSLQVVLDSGFYHSSEGVCHSGSLMGEKQALKGDFYARKVYLHEDCFGCVMKQMAAKAGATFKVEAKCQECPDRFECYTGNKTIFNQPYSHYIPSGKTQPQCPKCNWYGRQDVIKGDWHTDTVGRKYWRYEHKCRKCDHTWYSVIDPHEM